MQTRRVLDYAVSPDGLELVLYQRGDMFVIQIDGEDLMGSRAHGSEEELARLALSALGERASVRVLVGGLGLGFTLRATLDALDELSVGRVSGVRAEAAVVVAELFPSVVRWNREILGHLAGRPLDDPRVEVAVGDVADRLEPGAFDIVLLDVDNGPEALTLASNRNLYGRRGIARLRETLRPGGVVAVWSAGDDPRFTHELGRGGFEVAVHRVRARASGKGSRHVVFVGRRGA